MATVQPDAVTRGGGASQKRGPGRSPFFTSTCPARLQSPPMPGCRGCAISAYTCPARTFGLSMAGMYRRDGQSSQKSIHRFGGEALRRRIVTTTNTTHSPLRNGCAAPTLTVHSRVSWLPLSRLLSAKQRILRAGYWEFNEPAQIAPNVGGRPAAPATCVVAVQRSPELVCPGPACTRLRRCSQIAENASRDIPCRSCGNGSIVKHQQHHRTATSVFYFGPWSGVSLSMTNMFGVACLLNSPLIALAVATNQSGDPVG